MEILASIRRIFRAYSAVSVLTPSPLGTAIQDFVEPTPKKRGKPRLYSDEERKERHKVAANNYYHRKAAESGRVSYKNGETKLGLGVSIPRDGRKAYNTAYYLHTKATGNKKG